ncbi:MAG: heparan-alpha-glucosaminide N-acetyltransferase [archaeon]
MPILNKAERFFELDFLRGIAIFMMMAFHTLWDLNYFKITTFLLYEGFFGIFQKVTAGLFIFLVGICLTISYERCLQRNEDYKTHFLKRGLKVFGYGLLITIFTFFAFPNNFIYFGILHFISISILLSIFFIKLKDKNLLLAILLFLIYPLIRSISLPFPYLLALWPNYYLPTFDYFPLLEWFPIFLLGLFFGQKLYPNGVPKIKLDFSKFSFFKPVNYLGRHSLFLYFIHQPILVVLIWLVSGFS